MHHNKIDRQIAFGAAPRCYDRTVIVIFRSAKAVDPAGQALRAVVESAGKGLSRKSRKRSNRRPLAEGPLRIRGKYRKSGKRSSACARETYVRISGT
jgi:hypothetical protein